MALTLWSGNAVYLYLTVSFIQMLKVRACGGGWGVGGLGGWVGGWTREGERGTQRERQKERGRDTEREKERAV